MWIYPTASAVLNSPGKYKAIARGRKGGDWVDFEATTFATNPATFTVEQPLSRNVDVALAIDRSDSMNEGNRFQKAKDASNTFVGFMQTGDNVGVVAFETSALVFFPLQAIAGDATKASAQSAINRNCIRIHLTAFSSKSPTTNRWHSWRNGTVR